MLAALVSAYAVVVSVATFAFYARDKRAARAGRRRTPESTLLILGLIGGWPGGLVAQRMLRHKTRKRSFQAQFWLTVVVNVAAIVALVWLGMTGRA
jgi:uncharacterized membrane protein YsdA (DUF1294 family)